MPTDLKDPSHWEKDCVRIRRSLWQRERRLKQFDVKKEFVVLDLGCGDGLNTKIIFDSGVSNVSGIDVSSDLLILAKANNPTVTFKLAAAEKIPFKDNYFDLILVDSVFHHLINSPKALKEIKRVLKKKGFLCFSEPHNSIARQLFDYLTFSSLRFAIPYLNKRRSAYLAEKKNLENWLKKEPKFVSALNKEFKKVFLKYDLLSVVGKYQKI